MLVFYFLMTLAIWQGVRSVIGGGRFLAHVRRETGRRAEGYAPYASVIVPCRGLDQNLRDNLRALFCQDYPQYELIFVADDANDPALTVVRALQDELRDGETVDRALRPAIQNVPCRVRLLIAGPARDRGQKVHNLSFAVREADPASEVLVFVDTDARPHAGWLRALVAPLADETVGAATGYRWFLPVRDGLASHLRSVWNASIASALGPDEKRNFCWGGSTAIRRVTFDRARVMAHWRGALSDDFALTRALQNEGLRIHFVPDCLLPSHEDCSWGELLEFTTRQLKITRVYAPHLWRLALIGNALFALAFWGGMALSIARASTLAACLVVSVFVLGALKAWIRLCAVLIPLARLRDEIGKTAWAHLLLWPIASVLFLYNTLLAAWSRRLTWRGIEYELKSPTETVIIGENGCAQQDALLSR
jgi:ceramide glucosyltransferase